MSTDSEHAYLLPILFTMSRFKELQSQQLRWKNGISERQASSISQNSWDEYKDVISEKYFKMTLTQLMQWMKDNHGFVAT
jgi:Clr5 domain